MTKCLEICLTIVLPEEIIEFNNLKALLGTNFFWIPRRKKNPPYLIHVYMLKLKSIPLQF